MMALLAAALVASAILAWPQRSKPADRLAAMAVLTRQPLGSGPAVADADSTWSSGALAVGPTAWRQLLAAGPAAIIGYFVVGDLPGIVVGAVLAIIALTVARRREAPEVRRTREKMAADLPFAVDLMVACLRAGQPIGAALDAAAHAVGGPLGERLAWVGSQIRLGAAPQAAWATLATERSLAPLSRTMTRAVLSGAPVADALVRLADDARQEARATASAAARRVGVQVVAPLGLCFLPAFVLLGIIPVVAGLMTKIVLP